MREAPLISVIIPVHNVERYLEECLNSFLSQKTQNFEIIAVDDGSTDSSSSILKRFEQKYSFIHVFTQEQQGVSIARNNGLKQAKGEYIWFVDSDDYIADESTVRITSTIEKYSHPDIVRFGFELFDDITKEPVETYKFQFSPPVDSNEYFKSHAFFFQVCSGIYKKSFIQKIDLKFVGIKVHEDVNFNIAAFSAHAKMVVLDDILYFYRAREGSALRSQLILEKVEANLFVLQTCDRIIQENINSPKDAVLAVRKKLDILYQYVDGLIHLDNLTLKQKLKRFNSLNLYVPVLNSDTKGLILTKFFLKTFPRLFFITRKKQLGK